MRNSLRTRMRVLILTLMLILGIVSVGTFRYLAGREAEREVASTSNDTSLVLSTYIQHTEDNLALQLRNLGESSILKNATIFYNTDDFTLSDRLANYSEGLDMDALVITDGTIGRVRYSQDARPLSDRSKQPNWTEGMHFDAKSPGVSEALEGGQWRGVIVDRGRVLLRITTGFTMGNGRPGALVGLKVFDSQVAQIFCFSHDDRVVAFVDGNKVLASSKPLTEVEIDPNHSAQWATAGGSRYLGGYRSIPGSSSSTKLGMVAYSDYSVLLAPYERMNEVFMILLGSLVLVALFFVGRFTKSLTEPLDQIAMAAIEMRNGKDPKLFEPSARDDEVSALQRVFNDMVVAVQDNRNLLMGLIDIDPLTGLRNHRYFQEHLANEFRHARESERPLSVILFDIDRFKAVNTEEGLKSGDEHLKAMAAVLARRFERPATVARFGGDEFAVIVPGIDAAEAQERAERVSDELAHLPVPIRCSVGIGDADLTAENADALVLSVELAVRRAKQLGGNRVSRFGSELDADHWDNSQLLSNYFTDGNLAAVQALAAAVDARDKYTHGHSERVGLLAKDLALKMQCTQEFADMVYAAGTLHDVGKIGVPDAVLYKPEELNDEEMQVMETHTVLGEVIVGKIPSLQPLLPGVRSHHERWDGAGYPDGLAGEDIPILARYLAVSDTFDAMTSDRPYRPALAREIALAEIERCAGTQFQAELAIAFVAMMREAHLAVPGGQTA